MNERFFGSDNHASVHPAFLKAIEAANTGHQKAYGDDMYTHKAEQLFSTIFGPQSEVFFTFLGTGANILALSTLCKPYHAVLCAHTAHVFVDECAAFERFNGSKLQPIATPDGKLSPELIAPYLTGIGFEHHAQPKVISISQPTELGTVYSIAELKELCSFAHKHKLMVHMDGARLANAAAHLACSFADITTAVGIDVLSFGGTKNGMMYGEAVVFLQAQDIEGAKYVRKQAMQLASKMRFISAQFISYLENDLWRSLAQHANQMAQRLQQGIADNPQVKTVYAVQSNAVFVKMSAALAECIREHSYFYDWDEQAHIYRWMCAWDVTKEDVDAFVRLVNGMTSSNQKKNTPPPSTKGPW